MKVDLELPDWVEGRRLRVFAGIEVVATLDPIKKDGWKIKKTRCSMCGFCCGDCEHLTPYQLNKETGKRTYRCGLGIKRPFACSVDNPYGRPKVCSISYFE